VFATDIDSKAINLARGAAYPASVVVDISKERLARFFIQESDGSVFRIHRAIRDLVVFSEQNVIKDPPFSKVDLISCRNLLIYMGTELQKKLIPLFHYALNPGGMLFLGSSEGVGEFGDLFATIDPKYKLYLRKDDVPSARRRETFPLQVEEKPIPRQPVEAHEARRLSVREVAERAILHQYAPAGVLVNERGDILYLHGRTGQYLEPPQGEAGMNILNMAREGLRPVLATTLRKALVNQAPVHQVALRVKTNGDFSQVNLTVQPVPTGPVPAGSDENVASKLFLVVFDGVSPASRERHPKTVKGDTNKGAGKSAREVDPRIAAMTQELQAKDEYVAIISDDLQSTNEAFRSSKEEMQSVNDELQASNEELQTSREELQSVNEELATVNAELQTKVDDLSRLNSDMNNLLAGTGVATIFVDAHMRIRHFTPAVTQAINLIPTDVGRPVGHIASNLIGYDSLVADVQSVLDTLAPKEVEVETRAGEWYLLRMRPYRTLESVVEGAVITFTEITELRKAQRAQRDSEALRRLAVVVRDANDAITVRDVDGRILAWNPAAQRMYGWSEAEALAMNIRAMIPQARLEEELSMVRRQSLGEILETYRTQRITKDGRIADVVLASTALVNSSGQVYAIATTEKEIN
jgi:two-component system CheB/CheR fusion protein